MGMAQEPGGYVVVEGCHTVHIGHIDHFLERLILLLKIVETFLIKELSEIFNRGLGTILFLNWHIQIINKDEHLLFLRPHNRPGALFI